MKKGKCLSVLTAFLIIALIFSYYYKKISYAEEQNFSSFPRYQQNNTSLKIGIIGDSWVVRKPLGKMVQDELTKKGIKAEVFSSGNPGATTRQIYENLFKNETEEYSSKFIIRQNPDYCIVIAGVNDAATHVGVGFYAHHIAMISKFLLKNNIRPIIVTIPKFGLQDNLESKNLINQYANIALEYVVSGGEVYQITDYRRSLNEILKKENIADKVIVFNFDQVSSDYSQDKSLYADPLHLNPKGYQIFSEALAESIARTRKK